MASWRRVIRCAALSLGVVALVAACSSGGEKSVGDASKASATATIAPDVPAGFDACKDIPQSLIQSDQLKNKGVDQQDGDGGIKWRGCIWIQSDGYSATIDTTNITLTMVRANHDFAVDEQLTVGGRPALTSHVSGQDPHADCVINVEMKGGSIEVSIDNAPSARLTGTQNSCDIAKRVAGEVVPAIPANL